MDLSSLKGKGALITGAGSGINLAFAKLLYSHSCSVLIADIGLHKEAVAWLESIKDDKSDNKVVFHKTDVSKWSELQAAFDKYAETFGGVPNIVCPGAGIYEPSHRGFWKDDDEDSHYQVLDINLLHPIKMSRIAIRRMLNADSPGIICCISSVAAQIPSIITPLYGISKAGVSHFVRCMAKLHEMAGIRVVGVAPGLTGTPLFFDHPEANKYIDRTNDRMIEPQDMAQAMLEVCLDTKCPSGTMLEVTSEKREVMLLNDPGPQGKSILASKKDEALSDVAAKIEEEKNSGR